MNADRQNDNLILVSVLDNAIGVFFSWNME
jgi:hypothetical protein